MRHNGGRSQARATPLPTLEEASRFSPQQVVDTIQQMARQTADLQRQLDWLKRQVFRQKSERRLIDVAPGQMSLGEVIDQGEATAPPDAGRPVAAHVRKSAARTPDAGAESLPFFDASRVPVEVIELPNPEVAGLAADEYLVIGAKETFRLAQRPGSHVVIKYVRPVVKLVSSQALTCAPAPAGVIDGSRADVSFVAGLLVDKFAYPLPLYRQHQRLQDAGFHVSRPWLTQLAQQGAALLEPIHEALLASIRASRVLAMDETPIKAGQTGAGRMKQGCFWPIYGERDEVAFPFFESRRHEHVSNALGRLAPGTVLLSDGYAAYALYAEATGIPHAPCWAHSRRLFFEAKDADPERVGEALDQIGSLYAVEALLRDKQLRGERKRDYRLEYAKPVVHQFFDWVERQLTAQGLLPRNPLTQALAYVRERRAGLEVFLTDPDVPIDTNHLERALRVIPMGRKSRLFCWTELGARQVGIVQSLIATCRLHGVDPYDYLVDVLQRVARHPAAKVALLTPRLWRQHFAPHPLRSDLYRIRR